MQGFRLDDDRRGQGRSVRDAETLVEEFRGMATGTLDPDSAANHLGKLKVFAGVKDLPSRVKCAILPWHTLHAALNPVLSQEPTPRSQPKVPPILFPAR